MLCAVRRPALADFGMEGLKHTVRKRGGHETGRIDGQKTERTVAVRVSCVRDRELADGYNRATGRSAQEQLILAVIIDGTGLAMMIVVDAGASITASKTFSFSRPDNRFVSKRGGSLASERAVELAEGGRRENAGDSAAFQQSTLIWHHLERSDDRDT